VPLAERDGVDVLAFAPHPDDAELFCGGTLLVAQTSGQSTAIVDMTEGELSTNGDGERRHRERAAAAELLGLSARVSLGLPDGGLRDGDQRAAVVDALRELAPRVVLAPYGDDRHPDHAAAAQLVRASCFLAGLRRNGGRPHRPARVYWYMLHKQFDPAVVVDVTEVWERRRELMLVFESQVALGPDDVPTAVNDGRFIAMLEARAVCFGAMAGVTYGEPLHVDGPLLLRKLPELERDARPLPGYRASL
jgi:bacillithiol biosynthesis deacetylase BshB1